MLWTTPERFKSRTDPDVRAWQELSPAYAAAKRGLRILPESGALYRDVHYQVLDRGTVVVGAMCAMPRSVSSAA